MARGDLRRRRRFYLKKSMNLADPPICRLPAAPGGAPPAERERPAVAPLAEPALEAAPEGRRESGHGRTITLAAGRRVDKLGVAVVAALHAAVLYGLWHSAIPLLPRQNAPLFVSFVPPEPPPEVPVTLQPPAPAPKPEARPRPPERPRAVAKPRPVPAAPPRPLVAQAPVLSPTEPVGPPPSPEPVVEAAPQPVVAPPVPAPAAEPEAPPKPAGPVILTSELSVICPERTAPEYPAQARRRGEQGQVVLRVNLDETGRVSAVRVVQSATPSLDEAALAAVRGWHCNPARRDGQAVRAVATQPFNFALMD